MDGDCGALLPRVLKVLADPTFDIPDDTCLEKLLDWLQDQARLDAQSLVQEHPCIPHFISAVCTSESPDAAILAFAVKFTGILAANEGAFLRLDETGVIRMVFGCEEGIMKEMWEDPSVRSAWLHGLGGLVQHERGLRFFCESGLNRVALECQHDKSLFVTSGANNLLAHILNFACLPQCEESVQGDVTCRSAWDRLTVDIVKHISDTLSSDAQFQRRQALKLLALTLPGCRRPLLDRLWAAVLGPLELQIKMEPNSLVLPVMETLEAASRTDLFGQSDARIEDLIEAMLTSGDPNKVIQSASAIIHLEQCSESLKRKALDFILQPLLLISSSSTDTPSPVNGDSVKVHRAVLEGQLTQKSTCVPLLSLSLTSVSKLTSMEFQFMEIPEQLVIGAVMELLWMCLGESKTSTHLIGCSRLQRCCLDALSNLSTCQGGSAIRKNVLEALYHCLRNPDSEPTVLQKSLQAVLKWICVGSYSSELTEFLSQDLFPVLKRRVCDVQWEVRDSTLEFITQLSAHFTDNSVYRELLDCSGILPLLLASAEDGESYVRASAIAALGQAVTTLGPQGVQDPQSGLQDDVVTRLMTILAEDSEGFSRRAVVKVFTSWLKYQDSPPGLDLHGVLSLGSDDLDWEVKMYTLELAEALINKSLGLSFPNEPSPGPERPDVTEAQKKLEENRVLPVLLKNLFDYDRPVAHKACQLLLRLREDLGLTAGSCDSVEATAILGGGQSAEEMVKTWLKKRANSKSTSASESLQKTPDRTAGACVAASDWPTKLSFWELLNCLDLELRAQTLSLSSDHVVTSPRSLMEDILSAAQQSEDNMVDCY
ncbi:integrator complex assembly factor BRAT1 isoform X2 [Denticeps clupeoides]|uniref:integrator complex assembly factor BRAT1 isoform X2 n=1 Tax=Denticeps clupeoides TaxID=299321 RepID=UPI0010A45738|nr:BRCA1-associated ATM activator 1 isoform X2 [Denticeps clupeoides]